MLPNAPQINDSARVIIVYLLGLAIGRGWIPETLQGPLSDIIMVSVPILSAMYYNRRSALIGKTAEMLKNNGGGTIIIPSPTEAASIPAENVISAREAVAAAKATGTI